MKIKAFVLWVNRSWYDAPKFEVWPCDPSNNSPEYVLVKEIEVDVEIPEGFDPTPGQIAALKEKKKEILAKAHFQAENIEEQIQRLLAIEFKP